MLVFLCKLGLGLRFLGLGLRFSGLGLGLGRNIRELNRIHGIGYMDGRECIKN